MYLVLCLSGLLGYALAQNNDGQFVKSVKGGGGGWQYNPSVNYDRFYGHGYNMRQNMSQHGYNLSQNASQHGYGFEVQNTTKHRDNDVGVCYIEVPTAQLARNPAHIPAGNGSRPDLSRIRTCCKGYIRNIHNYRICDPICTQECVNALCTAPETCSCFPDHVKNLAGICVPTCPIGCQNGHCSGGECLCENGYKLNSESQFCVPSCKENCGGIGNCTAPNTCECKIGYQSTAEGSCKPVCDRCVNGECVAPSLCRCLPGFTNSPDGSCKPSCDQCRNGDCVGPNTCRCHSGYGNEQPGVCVPQCNPGCGTTSLCVAPNVCDPPITQTTSTTPATHSSVIPNYPIYIDNQVRPNSSQSGYPGIHVQPYPGNQPNMYPGYSGGHNQPNPSYPGYPGTREQPNALYPELRGDDDQPNPSQSQYPGNQSPSNPSYPGYPGNQAQPNPSQPGYPTNGVRPDHSYSGYPGNQPNPVYPGYSGSQVQTNVPYNGTGPTEDMCSQPCLNGICVGVNTCRCNPGYYLDRNDPTGSRCIPQCPGGCINGVCSAPNFCICNMGYYKDTSVKGRPSCVKRIRRSALKDNEAPVEVAELLIFEIPSDIDPNVRVDN